MPALRSAAVAFAIAPFLILSASAQDKAVAAPSPQVLLTRNADLPTAPEPQSSSSAQSQPQSSTAPSLSDLGLSPDQTKADMDAQHRLDVRSHDLKVHQTLGLVTLLPITAACLTSALAPPDPRRGSGTNDVGRDIHVSLGAASVAMYGFTAYYAIKAPRIQGQGPTKGGIKVHKYLVAIHAPGMVLTPILGAMAYNQASNGQKVTGIASAHGAVALITAGAYAGSIIAVSWPLHFPGHHSFSQTSSTTSGDSQ